MERYSWGYFFPDDVVKPGDDYQFRIMTADGTLYGDSDVFSVR
jgi:hypothetical protein